MGATSMTTSPKIADLTGMPPLGVKRAVVTTPVGPDELACG